MKALYKFDEGPSRAGTLSGIFFEDTEFVNEVLNRYSTDRVAYLGEVLGKHSDVEVLIDSSTITLVTSDADEVKLLEERLQGGVGYNPFDYLPERLEA